MTKQTTVNEKGNYLMVKKAFVEVVKTVEKYEGYYVEDYVIKVANSLQFFTDNYIERTNQTTKQFHQKVVTNLINKGYFVNIHCNDNNDEFVEVNGLYPKFSTLLEEMWDTWNYDTNEGTCWEFDEPFDYPYHADIQLVKSGLGSRVKVVPHVYA